MLGRGDRERAEICSKEGKGVVDLIQEWECKLGNGGSKEASIVGNGGSYEQQQLATTPTTKAPTHGQAARMSPTEAWATTATTTTTNNDSCIHEPRTLAFEQSLSDRRYMFESMSQQTNKSTTTMTTTTTTSGDDND